MKTVFEALQPEAKRLKLSSMLAHAIELNEDPETVHWSHAQWLETLFKAEVERREQSAVKRRVQNADLDYAHARVALIDWSTDRGLSKGFINNLATCDWIRCRKNLIISGATGCGKTWVADALAWEACSNGFKVKSIRLSQLLREYQRLVGSLTTDALSERQFKSQMESLDLLLIDDWGFGTLDLTNSINLYEILKDFNTHGSVLIVSVLPVKNWATFIGDLQNADSILDRIVHSAHRIEMTGDSMRGRVEYGAIDREKEGEKSNE